MYGMPKTRIYEVMIYTQKVILLLRRVSRFFVLLSLMAFVERE